MSQSSTALLVTVAAGLLTSVLFSFLFTASLAMFVKDSETLKDVFGIVVDLDDNKLEMSEWLPAIRGMVTLWLFFALMRIVHHNVDMIFNLALSMMPSDVPKLLKAGGM